MKILGFSTSNKKKSINKQLVQSVAHSIEGQHSFKLLDIAKYELPIYSEDIEAKIGIPEDVREFYEEIKKSDFLIIGLAEHNGNYTAFYKNLFDWTSRIEQKVYQNKKVIALSTSPGPGGAKSVLKSFNDSAPLFGANIIASLSLPSFYKNFEDGVVKEEGFLDSLNQILLWYSPP